VGAEPDVVVVGEDLRVGGRQPVAALQWAGRRIIDVDQPAGRMVLEPFPHVPLGGAGPRRELRRGCRATVGQRPVEAEPLAEVNGEEFQGAERVAEEPIGEGLGRVVHE
jgi:hypothetical protein